MQRNGGRTPEDGNRRQLVEMGVVSNQRAVARVLDLQEQLVMPWTNGGWRNFPVRLTLRSTLPF